MKQQQKKDFQKSNSRNKLSKLSRKAKLHMSYPVCVIFLRQLIIL